MKVGIIWGFDRQDQKWASHHQFWEAALHDRGHEVHRWTWENWQKMPTDYDYYFFVDFHPNLFKVGASQYHPRVFYWWDCFHHSFVYPAQITELFDHSYFAEHQVVKALRGMGLSKVKWLPPAFYPGLYRPVDRPKLHHWAFVGQPDDVVVRKGLTRKDYFQKLSGEFGLRGYLGQGIYGDDLNAVYNESAILLDRTICWNVGTRVFETIGSGGFALINRSQVSSGIDELAVEGAHYVSYDDSYGDCLDKIRYYLDHSAERKKIAERGHAHFLNNHTYQHRLAVIEKDLGI